jgi:phytoene synthase
MQESVNITRKSASNLALAFVLLPKEKREAMAGLYAFCREVDDVADNEDAPVEERRANLQKWRLDIRKACEGETPEKVVNQELQPWIKKYGLSFTYFDELIKGVEMDLDIKRYSTQKDLELYCYRVASVVGLLSIPIFEYKNQKCHDYAIYLGKALQLTNILRDVRTDAEKGRIYLPLNVMSAHGVSEADILAYKFSANYKKVAVEMASMASEFYRLAHNTLPPEDRKSMVAAELMGSVYWGLLKKLERQEFNVFGEQTTRLTKTQKIFLILRTWFRISTTRSVPNYGA